MFTVEQRIEIEAAPGEVFAFVDDPRNHVKITPGLIAVDDIEALPDGGKRAQYRYKLAGVKLTGQVADTERRAGERLVQTLEGAIEGTLTYDLAGADGRTELTYAAEYELPSTVIDTVMAPIAEAYNRREAEATVRNLKTHLEADI